ncbi:MAG: EAL domain-containing protein, partial [bacterium]
MSDTASLTDLEHYILDHLDEALREGHVKVYLQPVVRTFSGQVCGFEALARWEDPVKGFLYPNQFIGALEKHRRIHELDSYIVRRVCEHLGRNRGEGDVPISINLSRLDYELCDIFEVVESAVRANMVHRGDLCIEITESVLADNEALMRGIIDRFRSAGYPVWMDDFGSGYSSLNVLKDFEFDELKIDMRFLSDFHAKSKKILASIVHMAKQLGIQTLAEGVETAEQFDFLRNIGCEKIQGYLFGKPMPFDQCLKHIREKGLTWETPALRRYYDAVGGVDVLSATPFNTDPGKLMPNTGREMNSIPLALLELRGDQVGVCFTNEAFEQMAADVNWGMVFSRTFRMDTIPLNRLSAHLKGLLEETRTEGRGRMLMVFNEQYYEINTLCVAAHGDRVCILMRMVNLSQSAELENQKQLDEGLRSLYSMYERVVLIDLNKSSASMLYMDADAKDIPPELPLANYLADFARTRIFPEDRTRFLRFTRPTTLEERVLKAGTGSINLHLRALTYHGAYGWKCFLLVRIRENVYYMLVRDASGEVREFQSATGKRQEAGSITPDILWANLVNNASLKFFWKDHERRFLGVSRSFLEHYEIRSVEELLGKTDEDMGWHIHPDVFRAVEEQVIYEGITSRQVVGSCLIQGENRDIIATKMPIYDPQGEVVGLLGYFSQVDDIDAESGGEHAARLDNLTGLLNSRGIYEDLFAYVDEYERRGTDFVRIEVAIDDFDDLNARYGYDFGDAVIRETGKALLQCCGNTATVGRVKSCNFTVLTQYENPEALDALLARIRFIPAILRKVDGVPFSMYLSVGSAVYSETENREDQSTQADMRRITDDVENISRKRLREKTFRLFQMYDDLPLAYAVYKVVRDGDGLDAIVLYGNREYCEMVGRPLEELVGCRV